MRWLALCALLPGLAAAHPSDEVAQAAYLFVTPAALRLELEIVTGSEVAAVVLHQLDPDGNRSVSTAEAQAYGHQVLAQAALALDGVEQEWRMVEVIVPPLEHLEQGMAVLRIVAEVPRPDAAGEQRLDFRNSYRPIKSLWMAHVFLEPGSGWAYSVTQQDRSADGAALSVLLAIQPR